MPYFDLHLHSDLLTLFLPQNGAQISAWPTLNAPTFLVGDILSSRSSLEQTSRNRNIPLICTAPPEPGMLNQLAIKAAAGAKDQPGYGPGNDSRTILCQTRLIFN